MNKKGKEGGSTWFNPRQTEIPLFKINKKKKKGESAGTLGESSRGAGHFVAGVRVIGSASPSGKNQESWAPLKFLFFVSVRAGVWGRGPASFAPRPPLVGGSPPRGIRIIRAGGRNPQAGAELGTQGWGLVARRD